MNKKDDNTITYIAYKVMILLILLICIFNASAISRVIFLPHYNEIEYCDFTIIKSYITNIFSKYKSSTLKLKSLILSNKLIQQWLDS